MRTGLALGLLVAACGPSAPAVTPPGASAAPRACPAADAVHLASWRDAGAAEYGGATYGTPADAHWMIPLHLFAIADPWDEAAEPTPPERAPGPRTAAEVEALGARALAGDAWIYVAAPEPCRAQITGYYVAHSFEGSPHGVIAARADGCAPPEEQGWIAWAAVTPDPGGCRLERPVELARRDGEPSFDGGPLLATTDAPRELPAPLASAIAPPRPCDAPACEPLYAIAGVTTGGVAVYDATVTWLRPVEDEDPCAWVSDDHHAIHVGPEGGPLTEARLLGKRDVWDEGTSPVPVGLAGVLADAGGPRVLLTTAVGLYGVHDLDGGAVGAGRIQHWYVPHEEDFSLFSLAPYCGP